jgi:quercetin dioxygenase-like cupin family protein
MTVRDCSFLPLGVLLLLAAPATAQTHASAAARNLAEMSFTPVPGLPTCATGAVQAGNPATGPSVIASKMAAGCIVPWHWHSPNEHLMLVSGSARVEMKDGKPFTLQAGGFALLPSKHVHQFRCEQACLLYVYSDAAFDTHYVDAKGTEISAAEALAAVKETAAMPPR